MGFPVREGELSAAFALQLRDAYQADYGKNIVVTSNWQIKWWKKVSFGDRYVSYPAAPCTRVSTNVHQPLSATNP